MQRIAELTARVVDLARRIELVESIRSKGNGRPNQQPDDVIGEADESSRPIEFLTENGFSIVRPWESDGSAAPTGGKCRFRVRDTEGNERHIIVEISRRLTIETHVHTCGQVQLSSSFWICCAERQLANYLEENDAFPDGDRLLVETLDPEEAILAGRWGHEQ